jgi:hypothetical protein
MRHRAIRELSSGESGVVINDLKPIWLMSPLSVSDTLPLEADLFDVVIFDEASQIPVEESVPALSRARQVVVVGDEMQLPPTSFFASGAGAGQDDIVVEEEGERIAIHLDSDSLLSQAARNLPATLLAWHYRSRHEALISFSNAAFYEGRLVTIPDQAIEQAGEPAAPLRSDAHRCRRACRGRPAGASDQLTTGSKTASTWIAATCPRRSTSRRWCANCCAARRRMSLGIVAFSEAQQGAIETALEALAAEDEEFARAPGTRIRARGRGPVQRPVREEPRERAGRRARRHHPEHLLCAGTGRQDADEFRPDQPARRREAPERDFQPRAPPHGRGVDHFAAEAITNVHNDGANALRAFLQFAQASSTGQFERAQAVLGALNEGARGAFTRQPARDSIRDALAQALRERGHEVHVNVGRSQFRCDLGDRRSGAAGVCAGAPARQSRRGGGRYAERYVFRPGILRSFGWRVLDLPGKDWLDDSGRVWRASRRCWRRARIRRWSGCSTRKRCRCVRRPRRRRHSRRRTRNIR